MGRKIAAFSSQALTGKNKVGLLKIDESGYGEIVLGGFNLYNNVGEYYELTDGVLKLFNKGGAVRRMVESGQWRGECTHPSPEGHKTLQSYISRLRRVDSRFVSHHIKEIRLEEGKDENGRKCVLAIGLVKGTGPYADAVNNPLNNSEENLSFSVRSITNTNYSTTPTRKEITVLVTYDHVNEPGIAMATKYNTPSLESLYEDVIFTEQDLIVPSQDIITDGVSLESLERDIKMIRTELGWHKTEIITPGSLTRKF